MKEQNSQLKKPQFRSFETLTPKTGIKENVEDS
jgi:hypothetical protein